MDWANTFYLISTDVEESQQKKSVIRHGTLEQISYFHLKPHKYIDKLIHTVVIE